MSKGKPLGICRTCQSEIVEKVNDGVFGGGECDLCERQRYESQPELLAACRQALRSRCAVRDDEECGACVALRKAIAKAEQFSPTRS